MGEKIILRLYFINFDDDDYDNKDDEQSSSYLKLESILKNVTNLIKKILILNITFIFPQNS